ncbi:GntR family transcriptional regulator [Sphaerisporangium melleum]|uniref:GntR family transcriptional regulator n=1 Tax=Sphaerisporangium melleum TaxID=321316 RepID=A0A917RQF7_9ACTN|nr:winged helix-turn-helix domain-containing protein [Sphaerisporangium melleum]GGL19171.1 GntR family transcriptional regulator [Sphaerisporangium melleum]GII71151.1 GntR family transcriptional regulator [Sphaerisporangium melleum]
MVQNTGRPGYLQIADELRGQITSGALPAGQALPSIAQLCQRYEVSASVVKAAISVLRTEGYVIGQQGKGVFVRDRPPAEEPPAEPPRDGHGEIMDQLAEIRAALGDLGKRLADLETAVFQEPKRSGQRGT